MIRFSFFVLLIFSSFGLFSQIKDNGKKIKLKVKNQPLSVVLKAISDQSGVPISYSNQQLPLDKKITVRINNESLEDALNEVLKPLALQYVFVENQIIVKPVPKTNEGTPTLIKEVSKSYTIKGYVKDKKSSESIVGATIYTSDTKFGTISNGYGFFSLTLPENSYAVIVSFIGYKSQKYEIILKNNENLNVALSEDEQVLEPVIVTNKEDSNKFVQINRMGYSEMAAAKVARMPLFFAEPDVIKAIQYMPGIKNTIDGSSNYYVRGGERDQNLILLDDAPIYNPSHLFGFFTCINPEAVTDIKFYKSDFPAYVGGKLASVMEVKTKEGNLNHFSMAGETGLITSRLSAEGPFMKNKSSYYISYRQSHIKALAQKVNANISKFMFNDLNAKFNFILNERNRLLYSFYMGSDNFYLKKWDGDMHGINWGNMATSLRWNKIYGSKLFSNTTFYYSKYDYNFYLAYNTRTRWNSMISTLGLKDDFTYYMNPKTTQYFGFSININDFNPGLLLSNKSIVQYRIRQIEKLRTGDSHLYYSFNRNLNDKATIRCGLNATTFSNKGPAKWYQLTDTYEIADTVTEKGKSAYNTYLRFEPSLTFTYLINNRNSLKFNYFRAHQYFQILSNSISPFTSIEIWYPSTPNVKPQSSDQVSLGYFSNIFNHSLSFEIEGFYKYMRNQFDYNNQSNLFLNPYIEKDLRFGTTSAYGTELTVKKEYGKFQGWIGYAYTKAVRNTKGVNNDLPYLAYSDRPYDVSIYLRYQPCYRWLMTSGIIYASGMPYTTPTGYFDYMGYKVPVYTLKNNSRMPDYFRWDVSFQYTLNKPGNKWEHYLTFAIFNLTNHKNPVFINFNKIIDENGKFTVPANYATNNQLDASQIILIGLIPSIKYNFKF